MQFTCLIYDPQPYSGYEADYGTLVRDAGAKGVLRGGAEFVRPSAARTVRVVNGERQVSDQTFAAPEHVVGGYMIFECASMEEALEWAARIPGARSGSVEVRQEVAR
jgi:hypothetical protein